MLTWTPCTFCSRVLIRNPKNSEAAPPKETFGNSSGLVLSLISASGTDLGEKGCTKRATSEKYTFQAGFQQGSNSLLLRQQQLSHAGCPALAELCEGRRGTRSDGCWAVHRVLATLGPPCCNSLFLAVVPLSQCKVTETLQHGGCCNCYPRGATLYPKAYIRLGLSP